MTSAEFKEIRIKLGFTQSELATIMGINQQNVARIERERQPTRIQAAFIRYILKSEGMKC